MVAVDGTSLRITDTQKDKGLGNIGSLNRGARGLLVMSALAVSAEGVVLGLCGQKTWVRAGRSKNGDCRRASASRISETQQWTDSLRQAQSTLAESAPHCMPWFQCDRGADCWQVLTAARELELQITIRATHDRRLDDEANHLWASLERARVVATKRIHVHARPKGQRKKRVGARKHVSVEVPARKARSAKVGIRATTVCLKLSSKPGRSFPLEVNAVLVTEKGRRASDRVEWMLLTTAPIDTEQQVLKIVHNYGLRWRIEDFHRMWKSGRCHVERTQLRSREAILKWATILATVATRAMRLTHLARETPDIPATTELSELELEAIVALRQPKNYKPGDNVTLAQAVRWIADLGGYARPAGGPPGAIVIGRGFDHVTIAAKALDYRNKMR